MVCRKLSFRSLSLLADLGSAASTAARLFVVLGRLACTRQALGRRDALPTHFHNELSASFVCKCLREQISGRV